MATLIATFPHQFSNPQILLRMKPFDTPEDHWLHGYSLEQGDLLPSGSPVPHIWWTAHVLDYLRKNTSVDLGLLDNRTCGQVCRLLWDCLSFRDNPNIRAAYQPEFSFPYPEVYAFALVAADTFDLQKLSTDPASFLRSRCPCFASAVQFHHILSAAPVVE